MHHLLWRTPPLLTGGQLPVRAVWRYAAAAVAGSSHALLELPCQDKFACVIPSRNSVVIAVADGAGSAEKADRGASIVVTSVAAYLRAGVRARRRDFSELAREAALHARAALVIEADAAGDELRKYASTLLAAIVTPHGGAAIQIGDGVIVVGEGEGAWSWVFWPQRGEFANTTYFLTDANAEQQLECSALTDRVESIALMTDGLEVLALNYQQRAVHEPFFQGAFAPLQSSSGHAEINELSTALTEFLSSPRVAQRTDDDVSLVLATRKPSLIKRT